MEVGGQPVSTVIVPVIAVGWKRHLYEYTPEALKVKVKVLPGDIAPLFHRPVSLVLVWLVVPLLVQRTVSPTYTVMF